MITTRIFLIILLFTVSEIESQNKADLENQKKEILNEIKIIENKLASSKERKGLFVSRAEDIKFKIDLQENLIKNINDQLNLILTNIEINEQELSSLNERDLLLKEELSKMVIKSYKSKSKSNHIMYVFSSSSFMQAYKRIQYFKQYLNFQQSTIKKINKTSHAIKKVIKELDSQKSKKQDLIVENQNITSNLKGEYSDLNSLILEINKNQNKYNKDIKQRQKLSKEIDKKIQKLIAEALSQSKKQNANFYLTEEIQLISKNFNTNKGKLPWPVSKGYVILSFGKQPHPIVKTTTIQSNGVRIRTSQDSEARTIFDGYVYSIIISKNNSHTILVQHGNFFTVYKNLSEIYVTKGEKLKIKQPLGKIATDKLSGQTILSFSIFNNGIAQDPSYWIYKM